MMKQSRPRTSSSTLTISSPSGNESVLAAAKGISRYSQIFCASCGIGPAGENFDFVRVCSHGSCGLPPSLGGIFHFDCRRPIVPSGTMLPGGTIANGPMTQSLPTLASPADVRERMNHGIARRSDAGFDVGGDRADDGDAASRSSRWMRSCMIASTSACCWRSLTARISSMCHGLHGDHFFAGLAEDAVNIGQIIFVFLVVDWSGYRGRKEKLFGFDAIIAREDLADFALVGGGIELFNDLDEIPFVVADDPAIAGWIIQDGRGHAGGGLFLMMGTEQGSQNFAANKRAIAGENEYVAAVFLQFRFAHPRGMPRAELLGLLDPVNALCPRRTPT